MIDGIYTVYMTGTAGQTMAMFVFRDGVIAGADLIGLSFDGEYEVNENTAVGSVHYRMPANSISITGAQFDQPSETISVPISLPTKLDAEATYRIETPIGPVNAKFIKTKEL